jgi:uncharacterized membrane protein
MDTRQRTTWGNRFRFLTRAAGLTGAACAAVGAALCAATLPTIDLGAAEGWKALPDVLRAASEGANGELAQVGAYLIAGGLIAVAVALVVELLGALFLGVGRRTAAGTTATVGIAAAVALLVIVNVYSFTHHARYDVTRDRRFTLPPEIAAELGKLRGAAPTTIVVLQAHNTFGTLSAKRDSFTSAAERQVTEKVLDLVDQFRAFGPQFRVVVLDTEAFGYESDLAALTAGAPELKSAIDTAGENSIFFHANRRVQRLGFNEFMQLDKTASREADDGRGNLVLVPQGTDRFARRILAVQERRPKVAVCVVHEALSTARGDGWRARYTMAGLRKTLTDAGFDVTDIVLKKGWGQPGGLKAAADTREESTLERLEVEERDASAERADAAAVKARLDEVRDAVARLKGQPWPRRRDFYAPLLRAVPAEAQEPQILALIDRQSRRADEALKEATDAHEEAARKLAAALKDERPIQDRRTTDVNAKFAKQLADVDLLIVPRFTTEDAMEGPEVEASIHALNRDQVRVAKNFMKSGKPVLACLGPITTQVTPRPNESAEDFDRRLATEIGAGSDEFERLLAERGVELGNSMVLFAGETKALAPDQFGSSPSEIPPIVLPDSPLVGLKPNPIAEAVRLTGRTAERELDLRLRAVRPLGLAQGWQAKQPFATEIAFTIGGAGSWNELQPFPRIGRRPDGTRAVVYKPKFEEVSPDDPRKGTRDEERRGPFAVGVAVENKIPAAWVAPDYERQQAVAAVLSPLDGVFAALLTVAAGVVERPTQRTVVFGSGGVFTGKELSPAQEKLLLHSVNWLTQRADRLPKGAADDNPEWRYPRVALSDRDRFLWRLGALGGLPLLVAYAGLLVMMRRRTR